MKRTCPFRKFQQGLISWTADALRIGEVRVDDPFKRFKRFPFRTHSVLPGRRWSPNPLAVAPLGESHDSRPLPMKIFVCMDPTPWLLCLRDASIGRRLVGRTRPATRFLKSLLDLESLERNLGATVSIFSHNRSAHGIPRVR